MFRNAEDYLTYRSRLRRAKVKLIAITQEFGDDAGGDFALGVLALGDEYNAREIGKHVRWTMLANAQAGFHNGQTPPLGYIAVEAERRGQKVKKKLAIDNAEAELVKTALRLYIDGDAQNGRRAMGITAVAAAMNDRGLRYRGRPFSVSNTHFVLTNTSYKGVAYYNMRNSKTRELRPESAWVAVPVPRIVSDDDWQTVQNKLRASNPRKTPPRVVSGPTVLVGLARCGADGDGCGGGMTISTGKSGAYKYYACSRRMRCGDSLCTGRRVPMLRLDKIVMGALVERILEPSRLRELLASCLEQSTAADTARLASLKALRTEKTSAEVTLGGLYRVAAAVSAQLDPVMKAEIDASRVRIATLVSEIALIERQVGNGSKRITPETVDAFGELLRQRLVEADPVVCQSYVRLLIERVEVGLERIRITGSKSMLAQCAAALKERPTKVPSFERGWCARRESNPRPAV